MNVLLLSGYWPVIGTGVAVASSEGRIALLVPEDEEDLAKSGWADEVRTFKPGSLDELTTTAEAIRTPLREFRRASQRSRFESALKRAKLRSRRPMPLCTFIAERCALCSKTPSLIAALTPADASWPIAGSQNGIRNWPDSHGLPDCGKSFSRRR